MYIFFIAQTIGLLFAGQFLCFGLLKLLNPGKRLVAKGRASPVLSYFIGPLVEVRLDSFDELVQAGAVLGLDIGDGHARSSLPASHSS